MQLTTVTENEASELERMASNVEEFNVFLFDHLLEVAKRKSVPTFTYDRMMKIYRRWLVFNEIPEMTVCCDKGVWPVAKANFYSAQCGMYSVDYWKNGERLSGWFHETQIRFVEVDVYA